jgi:hypothetical protein
LVNILIKHVNVTDSFGNGVQFGTRRQIDVRFEDCIIDGNATAHALAHSDTSGTMCAVGRRHQCGPQRCKNATCPGPNGNGACYSIPSNGIAPTAGTNTSGSVTVSNTIIRDIQDFGLSVTAIAPNTINYTFINVSISKVGIRYPRLMHFPNFTGTRGSTLGVSPVGVWPYGGDSWTPGGEAIGAMWFQNVSIHDTIKRPWLLATRTKSIAFVGNVLVKNKHGCTVSKEADKMPALHVGCNERRP